MAAALLTKQDLAAQVQCHVRTIDNLLARGEGPPPIRIGRLVRFRENDFAAWLELQKGDLPAD
jgi:excisionase family DNA binding protein